MLIVCCHTRKHLVYTSPTDAMLKICNFGHNKTLQNVTLDEQVSASEKIAHSLLLPNESIYSLYINEPEIDFARISRARIGLLI